MVILLWRFANLNLKSSDWEGVRVRSARARAHSTHIAFWHLSIECIYILCIQTFRRLYFVMQFWFLFLSISIPLIISSTWVFFSISFSHSILILRSFPFLVHTIFMSLCYMFKYACICMYICCSRWLCTLNAFKRYFINSIHYICTVHGLGCISVCERLSTENAIYTTTIYLVCNNNRFERSGMEAEQ